MKKWNIHIAVTILFAIITTGIRAQNISAEVDRNKISLGEQITLQLKISGVNPASKTIAQWFQMPDTINHLEVVERGKIDTVEVNGLYTFQQNITITSFDSGQWEIPALSIVLNDKVNSAAVTQTVKPIPVEVLPVDVSQLKDYHDIKEIIEVEENNLPEALIALIAITVISLVALYFLAKSKRQNTVAKPVILGNLSPIEWALQELEKLQKENLPLSNRVKLHYQKLTDISRQYFYLQLRQNSLQQTTDEWMLSLQPLPVEHDIKTSFFQLLRLADTVKFAKYLPPLQDNDQSVAVARQMLIAVSKMQQANLSLQNKTLQSVV